VKRLDKALVLSMHSYLLAESGGTPGTRDEGLLDSALEAPYAGFEDRELYPSLKAKAARLCFGLISNHAFVDGNKRIGVLAMMVLLDINGIVLSVTDDEIVELGVGVATGEHGIEDISNWIDDNMRSGATESPDKA